jgi:hypothetical protein
LDRFCHITRELDVVEGQGNGHRGTPEMKAIGGHVTDCASHSQWIRRLNKFDLQKQ